MTMKPKARELRARQEQLHSAIAGRIVERGRIEWPVPEGAPKPKAGDVALCCGHVQPGNMNRLAIFAVTEPMHATRDGEELIVSWLTMCRACDATYHDRPTECPFPSHFVLEDPS